MANRHIYLEDIPLEEARQRIYDALATIYPQRTLPAEAIPLSQAIGHVTAEPIFARISAPHYHAAAMDGYAVHAMHTLNATETRPITLGNDQIHAVNTGDPMPPSADAVIMIEHVQQVENGIQITMPVAPRQHVRMMGEDMVATELVLPANHQLRPVDIGALAGCGHHQVTVYRQPQVVIIPTGSELVSADQFPQPGQIIEYNSLVLGAQVQAWGGKITQMPITPDKPENIDASLQAALQMQPDLILLLSGTSAGTKDYSAKRIAEAGTLLVHGVAVRPGHPVIAGIVENTLIIGVPGYPVSAALTGELFVQPIIKQWCGLSTQAITPTIEATLTRRVVSPAGDDDFVRVGLAAVNERMLATPLNRGAGVITSLVRADGLAHIPRFQEGFDRGDTIAVQLYRDLPIVYNTLMAIGSHDPMLDLLGQYLSLHYPHLRLNSANVGSMGGLVALKRRESHLAGVHLLDDATGEYNIPDIQRRLSDVPVDVYTFAEREQGFIIMPNNPHNIQTVDDLARIRFVNRQPGAGTRLLLDYELKKHNIATTSINGYEHEQPTHLAVAAAVASGVADCGLGIRRAAIALGLDFVPMGWERYDFVIPQVYRDHQGIRALLAILNQDDFKQALREQPGYNTHLTGTLQYQS